MKQNTDGEGTLVARRNTNCKEGTLKGKWKKKIYPETPWKQPSKPRQKKTAVIHE